YGELAPAHANLSEHSVAGGQALDRALGVNEPNLDKKQWLMYWSIFGLLTTADHWAGPILRLFPMYRVAKIAVLVWAQHRKYNGAAWLYDMFVRPLLPPPSYLGRTQSHAQIHTEQQLGRTDVDAKTEAASVDTAADDQPRASFSSLMIPSVWELANGPENQPVPN
ncbi:hypothetical protein IWW50_006376, partial [Coemansia erecta]